jgi:transcriptional regulator with XRE-family HTH domain
MPNNLGRYLRVRREALGLQRSEVARLLGYENVGKGSARLHDLEQGRKTSRDFLERLMGILQIEPQVVKDLIVRDRQEYVAEWHRWANQPMPITAAIRLIPGFIVGINLPADVTTPEQAVAWAVETARQKNKKVFIAGGLNRLVSYTIHEDGRVDVINATPDDNGMPWSALGSTRFLVNLGGSNANEPEGRSAS